MSAPNKVFSANLARCITKDIYDGGSPPAYLFTSGKLGRCNPRRVMCLYMSEDRSTAFEEFDKYYNTPEPQLVFFGKLKAQAIIDLGG